MELCLMQHTIGGDPMMFYPELLTSQPMNHNMPGNAYVRHPEGIYCETCTVNHGYPSGELTEGEAEHLLSLLEDCTHINCSGLRSSRRDIMGRDELHGYFTDRGVKFNTFQELTNRYPHLDLTKWKPVRESETSRDDMNVGPVMAMLTDLPEPLLEDCRAVFPQLLQKLYKEKTGFVKGKFLVISTENLIRQCRGSSYLFMETLNQAYTLVESRYCSISRLAIESGFWQVCPEFGGFFWQETVLQEKYPFLWNFFKDENKNKNVVVRNFSLSMGPYYVMGGGYFSHMVTAGGKTVFWYVPNFWDEQFTHRTKLRSCDDAIFWYGWYDTGYGWNIPHPHRYGCRYEGLTPMDLDPKLLYPYYMGFEYFFSA